MHVVWCIALLAAAQLYGTAECANPCADPAIANLPFCNPDLDLITRAKDIVSRLNASEKVSQLGHDAPGIDRLKIPGYQWWSEALHGIANSPGVTFGGPVPAATSFPQVIGMGATFNMTLIHAMAQVISTEARAMYSVGQAGLTFFAPNINIFRDPRWGRGQETPGEDLENWNGTNRLHFNAIVADQDLIETYFPAFRACVADGGGASVMCSYNAVNGVPSCANDLFQNKVMGDQWGFLGFIVSDCGAVSTIENTHNYTHTPEDTVQVAMRAGTDLNCGQFYQKYGMDAYNKGKINDDDLNLAVGRLFAFRIALGMFDPLDIQPYANISTNQVNTPAHQDLALDASRESIVLLQNNNKALPLDKSKKVALIGPNANATGTMQGNYHGKAPFLISPLEGLQKLGVSVSYAMGCDVACENNSGFAAAVMAAKSADAVVLVVGLDESQAREGHDRDEISFPGMQEQLMDTIKKALPSTTPLIVALMSGSPVDVSWAVANADAILWVGYPGQAGGQAMAEVMLGMVNPSGRLPFTMYPKEYVDQISFFDMAMRTPPGRTYKFYTGKPQFQFGDGLSYTTFTYKWSSAPALLDQHSKNGTLAVSKESLHLASINYEVEVTNAGSIGGGVAVLAFATSNVPGAPLKQLIGFQKIYLNPGASMKLFFAATESDLSLVDEQG